MDLARSEVTERGTTAGRGDPRRPASAAGRRRERRGDALRLALMVLPVAFFGLFFAYPVAAIVGRGLRAEDGEWQLGLLG